MRKTVLSIQYLRGIAALLVVYYHAAGMAPVGPAPKIGAFGVDIFFVISGFIMWTTTGNGAKATSFAWHRLARIVPIYWLLTLVFFAAHRGADSIRDLGMSLFFIPYLSPKTGQVNPIVAVGWTLNFEMFFYVVFTLSLALKRRASVVFGLLGCLVACRLLFDVSSSAAANVYTSPLLWEFLSGCGIAMLTERTRLHPALSLALFAAGATALFLLPGHAEDFGWNRSVAWGVPAALIVCGAVGLERFMPRLELPLLLGDASYSIYLTHSVALVGLQSAQTILGNLTFVALGVSICALGGLLFYWLVERPVLALIKPRKSAGKGALMPVPSPP